MPRFLLVARAVAGDVVADVRFRAADIGTSGGIYVFAIAPAGMVRNAVADPAIPLRIVAKSRDKALPDGECVLAQLTASGQLVGVTFENLQAVASLFWARWASRNACCPRLCGSRTRFASVAPATLRRADDIADCP